MYGIVQSCTVQYRTVQVGSIEYSLVKHNIVEQGDTGSVKNESREEFPVMLPIQGQIFVQPLLSHWTSIACTSVIFSVLYGLALYSRVCLNKKK